MTPRRLPHESDALTMRVRQPRRRIILLAGPSGSGKGRVGELSGVPVLNLDDFYRDHTDSNLPRAWGIVDWDHPDSWNRDEALQALTALTRRDSVEIPTYSISASERIGTRVLDAAGAPLLIAEGIFASELVEPLRSKGLLADAIVLDRPVPLVFTLRLVRDVRQSRKSLPTLVRRGAGLAASQRADVQRWASAGMRRMSLHEAISHVRSLTLVAESESRAAHAGEGAKERVITVSAVCFVHRVPPGPGLPEGDWRVLGVRKRGTQAFMQPGGKPEGAETPLECAVREIKEELALTLNPDTLVSLGHASTRAANEANTRLEADLFLAPVVHNPGDFDVRAEIEELRWFSLQDLSQLQEQNAPTAATRATGTTLSIDEAVIAPLFAEIVVPELRERLCA